jgi:hypothetical protein
MTTLSEVPTGADELDETGTVDELTDQTAAAIDGTASGPDAEKGKLFEVPRVLIVADDADPTVLKLAFSGSIELDRAKDADLFNRIKAGKNVALEIQAFVKAGPTITHRRDSEGNVDAIVAQKSLLVHSVDLE